MLKLESKTGKVPQPAEKIFTFLSDFNNFSHLIPRDKIKDWQATSDTCKFSLSGMGDVGFKIIEKEPCKLIKVTGYDTKFVFMLWIQLKVAAENDSRIKFTLHAELNPFIVNYFRGKIKKS